MKRSASGLIDDRTISSASLDREPGNHASYEEYVRSFDEIPVLEDVVRIPPRRMTPPNFVRGERRNLRQVERPDGYTLRESRLTELEEAYQEYVDPKPVRRKRKTAAHKKKGSGRKRVRKSAAVG